MAAFKIVTFRVASTEDENKIIVVELGTKSIERAIPEGHGMVRTAAIIDEKGQLAEVELVTEKI